MNNLRAKWSMGILVLIVAAIFGMTIVSMLPGREHENLARPPIAQQAGQNRP